MATARDFVTQSLKDCGVVGVGQTPLAEDTNDAFRRMRQMLMQWQAKRWVVPSLTTVSAVGNGQVSNPIGPGLFYDADIRPNQIKSAYIRLLQAPGSNADISDFNFDFNDDFGPENVITLGPSDVDYPLAIIPSWEDYSKITLKGLNSFPAYCFYDNQYPVGNVYIWPIPSSRYQIFLVIQSQLVIPANLDDELILAPEYEEAVNFNLQIRNRIAYQLPPDKMVIQLAKVALNVIKNNNSQISNLISPLRKGNYGAYNIYSDSFTI